MENWHVHEWDVTTLEEDYIPGIPTYVTSCACGTVRPFPSVA